MEKNYKKNSQKKTSHFTYTCFYLWRRKVLVYRIWFGVFFWTRFEIISNFKSINSLSFIKNEIPRVVDDDPWIEFFPNPFSFKVDR
jgi:hypothetical protein